MKSDPTQFFHIHPEASGELGDKTVLSKTDNQTHVSYLHYEFQGWLGDDLLTSTPCFIVSERLQNMLQTFAGSGYHFSDVLVTKSKQFRELQPFVVLPKFVRLMVDGTPGIDDFGLTLDNRLIVSETAIKELRRCNLQNCTIRKKAFVK